MSLRFPRAPCVLAVGTDVAIPLELCWILPGQMVGKGAKVSSLT